MAVVPLFPEHSPSLFFRGQVNNSVNIHSLEVLSQYNNYKWTLSFGLKDPNHRHLMLSLLLTVSALH